MRTERVPEGNTLIDRRWVMPLFGAFEAALALGSAVDDIKRSIYYGQAKNPTEVMQKLGDWNYELPAEGRELTPQQYRMLHAALGLVTEAVEFLETVAKNIKDGEKFDPINVMEECGDIDWYKAIPENIFGFTIDQELKANIAKLYARYPDRFDMDKAVNRDLAAERKTLEQAVQAAPETGQS